MSIFFSLALVLWLLFLATIAKLGILFLGRFLSFMGRC